MEFNLDSNLDKDYHELYKRIAIKVFLKHKTFDNYTFEEFIEDFQNFDIKIKEPLNDVFEVICNYGKKRYEGMENIELGESVELNSEVRND